MAQLSPVVTKVPPNGDIGQVELTAGAVWVLRVMDGITTRTYMPLRVETGRVYDINGLASQQGQTPPTTPPPLVPGVWPEVLAKFPSGAYGVADLAEFQTATGGSVWLWATNPGDPIEVRCGSMAGELGRLIINIPIMMKW